MYDTIIYILICTAKWTNLDVTVSSVLYIVKLYINEASTSEIYMLDRLRLKTIVQTFKIIFTALHVIDWSIIRQPNRFSNKVSFCFYIILKKEGIKFQVTMCYIRSYDNILTLVSKVNL